MKVGIVSSTKNLTNYCETLLVRDVATDLFFLFVLFMAYTALTKPS